MLFFKGRGGIFGLVWNRKGNKKRKKGVIMYQSENQQVLKSKQLALLMQ